MQQRRHHHQHPKVVSSKHSHARHYEPSAATLLGDASSSIRAGNDFPIDCLTYHDSPRFEAKESMNREVVSLEEQKVNATSKCLWDSLLLAMIDAEMLNPLGASDDPPRIKEECLGFLKVKDDHQKESKAAGKKKCKKSDEEKKIEFKSEFHRQYYSLRVNDAAEAKAAAEAQDVVKTKTASDARAAEAKAGEADQSILVPVHQFYEVSFCAASQSACVVLVLTARFCRKE